VKKSLIDSLLPVLAISIITIGFLPVFAPLDAESAEYEIPTWVKGIAGFWVDDRISDKDFAEGLSFLITEGILQVPLMESLQNQVTELENQIKELEDEISTFKIELIRDPQIRDPPIMDPPNHGDPPPLQSP